MAQPLLGISAMKKVLLGLGAVSLVFRAIAVPYLQLDTSPGMYDPATQTTIATSNPFTLRALLNPNAPEFNHLGLTRTFYISAAIVPKTSTDTFGSFSIDGTTYSGSSGMQYGTPPVDAYVRDVGSHDIYQTFFAEISFTFDSANTVDAYNTANPSEDPPGILYYADFSIDITGLIGDITAVHFDLYSPNDDINRRGIEGIDFAPFSHDAQSPEHGIIVNTPPPVPDGATTQLLLGMACVSIHFFRRKTA